MLGAGRFIWLLLLGSCPALISQNCPKEENISCDHMGTAMLDTSEVFQKMQECEWSFTDNDDTVIKLVTPSQSIPVQCNLREIHLKVHCINPNYEFLACYKLNNETSTTAPRNHAASYHGVCEFVIMPVIIPALFLVMLAA